MSRRRCALRCCARDERTFLGYLAHEAIRQPAPIGMFGRLIRERRGQPGGVIDLKRRGADRRSGAALQAESRQPLDEYARSRARCGRAWALSAAGVADLVAAFEQINLLRRRHQYDLIRRGEPPANDMPIGRLSPQERRALRDALRVVARIQRSVVFSFQTAWFG
jgi:CBS domain-containing protein